MEDRNLRGGLLSTASLFGNHAASAMSYIHVRFTSASVATALTLLRPSSLIHHEETISQVFEIPGVRKRNHFLYRLSSTTSCRQQCSTRWTPTQVYGPPYSPSYPALSHSCFCIRVWPHTPPCNIGRLQCARTGFMG